MWGQQSVPQLQVLPIVDLVITHGGNNTVSEIFYFGKPMIVMPLFNDQYDNAQRIHEKGFGLRLDPYSCDQKELLEGIEKLLSDKSIAQKMNRISKRIQSENSISKLPEMVEGLCEV
jgi:UDP:flavonoid glycosyltransferase YjiC (YdhE family)